MVQSNLKYLLVIVMIALMCCHAIENSFPDIVCFKIFLYEIILPKILSFFNQFELIT